MNILISLHGASNVYNASATFYWEQINDERTVTSADQVVYDGRVYGGWSAFYAALQQRLGVYPDAKVFLAWSGSGKNNTTYQNGGWSAPDLYFKIRQCNPHNRNEGYVLQRLENGVCVNVHSDPNDAKGLLEYMNNTIRPNAAPPMPGWLNKLWISLEPNYWIDV